MNDVFKIKIFEDITPEIKAIRDEVFIKEQGISEEEEYKDDEAVYTHFCLYHNDAPIASTRMICKDRIVKIMEIAVLKSYRGKGHGNRLMAFAEGEAKRRGCKTAEVNAKVRAVGFYESLGYKKEGQFTEADIPHIKMVKRL